MSSTKHKPCFAFQKGQCKFGDRCRYRHDNSDYKTLNVNRTQIPPEDAQAEEKFRDWRYQIPKSPNSRSLGSAIGRFFVTGRDLVRTGKASTRQQVITLLANEGGLFRIKELTEKCSNIEADSGLFGGALLPFFQIISYPDVVSSLILEGPLDTIHQFLFGTGGRRAIDLFGFVASNITNLASEGDDGKLTISLAACLGVLQKIIDLNGTAQVIDNFHPVVETMSTCLGHTTEEASLAVQSARHSLFRVRARLGLGSSMPSKHSNLISSVPTLGKFVIKGELPGQLCSEGPRHDNDHENICDITILPTAQEIQSHRLEYLPTEGHLLGVEGLLDRHFRLLREDSVGPLRDAVRFETERLQANSGPETVSKSRQGARTIVYHNVRIRDLTIDKRHGLQIVAEFDQPSVLGRATAKERLDWWQHNKQLQIDSLLCLADSSGGSIFLSVCTRTEKPGNEGDSLTNDTHDSKVSLDREGKPQSLKPDLMAENWRVNGRANQGELTQNDFIRSGPPQSLSDNPSRAVITLRLAELHHRNVAHIQQRFASHYEGRQSMVEFPGILLPSFRPTLIALQQMYQMGDLPFSEFLAPSREASGVAHVPPPAYSLQPGFQFDLASITKGEPLRLSPSATFDFQALSKHSSLDDAQQIALVDALTRRLALIQGPPGTGKSYTGVALVKVLLDNSDRGELGPIICVCYTNHALDQLLEHLLQDGVEQIVRMGSRSKSEKLQNRSLRTIVQEVDETKIERQKRYECQQQLAQDIEEIQKLLTDLKNSHSVTSIKKYLELYHYHHYEQLFGEDDDGWQTVHHRPENIIDNWIHRGSFKHHRRTTRNVEALAETDLEDLSAAERRRLQEYWVSEIVKLLHENLMASLESYRKVKEDLDSCHQELDLRCLQQADVVGVTTSGLARSINMLRRLHSKVLLCEEAGEVLEAHTLTALLPSIEHAILIGDHEQLRPQIQNYELQDDNPRGKRFALNVSMFERLVRPKDNRIQVLFSTLRTQRRMHPSIADLVRETLYPSLLDHPSVHDYPEVKGLRRRRFWLDHREPEAEADTSQLMSVSKTNDFEVEMVAALVSHLVRQGTYHSEDIAVLTPYLGQLQKLRRRLASTFEIIVGDRDVEELEKEGLDLTSVLSGVPLTHKSTLLKALRLATVDNFQGEEAKVVVISLVRSNDAGICGFLKTSNRINVLLSRAQHGMYLIGNSQTYGHVPMWAKAFDILGKDGDIGQSLALCCPRHPHISIEVSKPDDFVLLAPEGGCNAKCNLRLSCGHSCVNKCHSGPLHNAVVCLEPCPRSMPNCDHACTRVCGKPCSSKCGIPIPNVKLPCGHIKNAVACSEAQNLSKVYCKEKVVKTSPNCHHKVKVDCSRDITEKDFECSAKCEFQLPCGHPCQRQCKDCRADHGDCTIPCGRPFTTCRHSCRQPCHSGRECSPCEEPCEVQCSHSRCNKKCQEPCAPCAQSCTWSCPHKGRCGLPCAAPCEMIPCSKRCQEILDCGHQCPSICGEKCPPVRYCQVCAPRGVKEMLVDYILSSTYEEVNLDLEPCIIPSCGHILTLESMDGHMSLADHYETTQDGSILGLKASSDPFTADLKSCPACRAPLRDINRYGPIVRRGLLDESTKKFITWSNAQFYPLTNAMSAEEQRLRDIDDELSVTRNRPRLAIRPNQATMAAPIRCIRLEGSRADQISTILQLDSQIMKRYRPITKLRKDISGFLHRVSEAEQPFGRIYDMVTDLRRRHGIASVMEYPTQVLQVRSRLLATVLAVRCDFAILSDFLAFRRKLNTQEILQQSSWTTAELHIDFRINSNECQDMVTEAITRNQPMHQVEGHLYFARFAALEHFSRNTTDSQRLDEVHEHLDHARRVCEEHKGQTRGMLEEIEGVETMLRDGVSYTTVTNKEKQEVYAAMAREFGSTGHWFYCANGHPFTIGECGGAMEVSRCPQCGVAVGGRHHHTVEGVRRARDIDEEFANMRI